MVESFDAYLNALTAPELHEKFMAMDGAPPTMDDILRYLAAPDPDGDLNHLRKRYRQINRKTQARLFVVPNEPTILEKLIWPLKHAQAAYIVGNYLGTIALCGMVAEMLTVLLYEIEGISAGSKQLDRKEAENAFGKEFVQLSQVNRVRVLLVLGIINQENRRRFDLVRSRRNKYMHSFSHPHRNLSRDAIEVYGATEYLVAHVIAPKRFKKGKAVMRKSLARYLVDRGLARIVKK